MGNHCYYRMSVQILLRSTPSNINQQEVCLPLLFLFSSSTPFHSTPLMAQRSHVPKFGNWDSENVPYTTYFENARSEKDRGSRIINPNDPEENPNFFQHGNVRMDYNDNHHVVRPPPSTPPRTNSSTMTPVEKRKFREAGSRNHSSNMHQIKAQHKSGSRLSTSTATESGSDISSSDRSLLQLKNQCALPSQKKNLGEGSNSFPPASPPSHARGGTHRSVDMKGHKVVSVPKFGAWDETDPASGEGFTIIFNKVKQEKQTARAGFPTVRPELDIHPSGQRNSPSGTKICCCFFSRSSK